jgi:hypothetical protein
MNNQDIVIDENQRDVIPIIVDPHAFRGQMHAMMHLDHQQLVDMLRAQNEEDARVIARAALVNAQAEAVLAAYNRQPLWRRIFRRSILNLRLHRNNRNN